MLLCDVRICFRNSYEIKHRILFEDLIVIRKPIVQTLKFATTAPEEPHIGTQQDADENRKGSGWQVCQLGFYSCTAV